MMIKLEALISGNGLDAFGKLVKFVKGEIIEVDPLTAGMWISNQWMKPENKMKPIHENK